ncbi:MAG: prepilin-type N-terminal cleavage/methylation domain-containing protein [Desulfobacter sp.]|nr:MAG: prepilin-type N-terminal cleavage/methylation domain-containing protein [Desulfobacter sp.]
MPLGSRGFTLLELLVVVAILAAVASVGATTFFRVREGAAEQVARMEMQAIAKALRQFKADTGYFPKTGPFNLTSASGGKVSYARLPGYAGNNDSECALWFNSPANFYQLFKNPLEDSGHALEDWNPETGRGWRGPYLAGFQEGYLDIRSGVNDTVEGTPYGKEDGSPLSGANIPDVEGIADPFEHPAEEVGGNTLLDWCRSPNNGAPERRVWGRPYLLFYDSSAGEWHLVSMGLDGTYGSSDDIQLNIK